MTYSWLFVPGNRPDRFQRALDAGAHRAIIDLEDAVAPSEKTKARTALAEWLASSSAKVAVRLNSADSEWFEDDVAIASAAAVATIVLPKAEDPAVVARLAGLRAGLTIVPLIESAAGFSAVRALAAVPGVERLAFGHIDFQVDMGMRDAEEADLVAFRSELVLATRLAGIRAPLDGVTVAIDDPEQLAADVRRARRLGFGGKLCIHPKQVEIVQAGFAPTEQELAWAGRVLAAANEAKGAAVAVDGKMVDKPVMLRAEAILRERADERGRVRTRSSVPSG